MSISVEGSDYRTYTSLQLSVPHGIVSLGLPSVDVDRADIVVDEDNNGEDPKRTVAISSASTVDDYIAAVLLLLNLMALVHRC